MTRLPSPSRRPTAFWSVTIVLLAASIAGCTRAYYRKSADREVNRLISEKSADPRWALTLPTIAPPEDSRLFDPGDPDHPPMPPDDPASHKLMERVDGKRGPFSWRKPTDDAPISSDAWLAALPRDKSGNVMLNLRSAVKIALKNSRDFQTEREDIYLSALDVTFERYRFDAQFSLGSTGTHTTKGAILAGKGAPQQTSVITDGSVRWLSASGGELIAGLANTLVWDFNGSAVQTTGSLLNFSLVQPLLRLGGRARVLESLTQSERRLLANVRQMEQFQHGYCIRITSGRNAGEGPSRNGSVGAAGLGLIAGTPSGTIGAPRADGLMGLLEEQQRINNLAGNVARLRESLDQLEAAFEAGRIPSRLQVDQARQALYSGQSSMLSTLAAYQTRLESYKIDLGLPPGLPVQVKDPLLDSLALTDNATTGISRILSDELETVRNREVMKGKDQLREHLGTVLELEAPFHKQLARVGTDLAKARSNLPERQRQLARLQRRKDLATLSIEPGRFKTSKLAAKIELLEQRLPVMSKDVDNAFAALRAYGKEIESLELEPARAKLSELASGLSGLLLALSLDQTAARLETLTLPHVDLSPESALAIAQDNRLDWMNARARLVDSWRQIGFNANALLSTVNLTVNGSMGTIKNDWTRLDARNGNLKFGLQFDSPLTRLSERNDYREALIDYQRARRSLNEFEDRVQLSLRNTLRIADLSQLNFELRRDAVQVAISQVDLARLRLDEPPRPGAPAQFGATTARDLVSALSDLLGAQNDFLSVWVSYQVVRMLLDFEIGTMRITQDGQWVDPGPMTEDAIRKRLAGWTMISAATPKQPAAQRFTR
jgi:hypothetical protein